jgi:hypothetical protein
MATQHCIQTIVGHRCEIWTLALAPLPLQLSEGASGEAAPPHQEYLLLTGSSDELVRGYLLSDQRAAPSASTSSGSEAMVDLSDEVDVLRFIGSIPSQGGEKCTGAPPPQLCSVSLSCLSSPAFLAALEFHSSSGLLLAISGLSSKHLELFRLRSPAEVRKKIKRRAKRAREKAAPTEGSDESPPAEELQSQQACLEDFLESIANLKSPHKLKSVAFGLALPSSCPVRSDSPSLGVDPSLTAMAP